MIPVILPLLAGGVAGAVAYTYFSGRRVRTKSPRGAESQVAVKPRNGAQPDAHGDEDDTKVERKAAIAEQRTRSPQLDPPFLPPADEAAMASVAFAPLENTLNPDLEDEASALFDRSRPEGVDLRPDRGEIASADDYSALSPEQLGTAWIARATETGVGSDDYHNTDEDVLPEQAFEDRMFAVGEASLEAAHGIDEENLRHDSPLHDDSSMTRAEIARRDSGIEELDTSEPSRRLG